jgi:rRNA processing protein Gar1
VKTQGKILIQLNGINLPRIGSKAFVKRDGKHKIIGEVGEAIGSTQNPWIVISANKVMFQEVQINEAIFAQQIPKTKKNQKFKRRRKHSKK